MLPPAPAPDTHTTEPPSPVELAPPLTHTSPPDAPPLSDTSPPADDASDALATAVCHGLLKGVTKGSTKLPSKGSGSLRSAFKHLERKI